MENYQNTRTREPDRVTAIVILNDNLIMLQHRDNLAWIEYPDHYSMFSGNVEEGELIEVAIFRELSEELAHKSDNGIRFGKVKYVSCFFRQDLNCVEHVFFCRLLDDFDDIILKEGQGLLCIALEKFTEIKSLVPHHSTFLQMELLTIKKLIEDPEWLS